MEFYSINTKTFKNNFFQVITIMALAVAACFFLLNNGLIILLNFDPQRRFTMPILFLMIALAVAYGFYRKKKLERVFEHGDFNQQLKAYENVYAFTLRWYLFSCLVSCFLAVLTARNIFLYYAFFDLLVALPYYPNKLLFKKELRNDEIILV